MDWNFVFLGRGRCRSGDAKNNYSGQRKLCPSTTLRDCTPRSAARRQPGRWNTRAQQPAMPVVALLDTRPPDTMTDRLRAFRQGLKDVGYVEGENVAIEYRSAENHWRLRAEMG